MKHSLIILLITLLSLFHISNAQNDTMFIIGAGMASKTLCSAIFVQHRTPNPVKPYLPEFTGPFQAITDLTEQKVNFTHQYVTTFTLTNPPIVRHAKYLGKLLGCRLVPKDSLDKPIPKESSEITTNLQQLESQLNLNITEKLKKVLDAQFSQRQLQTRAIVIVYKNKIVAERYDLNFTQDTPQLGWSMTKSLLNTLIGIRVYQGKMNITEKVLAPEWNSVNDPRREITVDQMLRMSSGLEFDENYGMVADVSKMLFYENDTAHFAANKKLIHNPDEKWYYSSGTSNILSRKLRDSFKGDGGDEAYWKFPQTYLFGPLGMKGAVMETDPAGNFVGSSFSYLTARDWAKYGLLYLHDGVWNGKRILPQGWVKYSITPTPRSDGRYGAHWWLPEYKPSCFAALGFQHQNVVVFPSKDLVVVRLGLTWTYWDSEEFYKQVIDAISD